MKQYLMLCDAKGNYTCLAEAEQKEDLIPIFDKKLQQMLDEGFIIHDDWRDFIEGIYAVVFKPEHLLAIGTGFVTNVRKI